MILLHSFVVNNTLHLRLIYKGECIELELEGWEIRNIEDAIATWRRINAVPTNES